MGFSNSYFFPSQSTFMVYLLAQRAGIVQFPCVKKRWLSCVVKGQWRGRKPHLRRFASLALLHVCIYTSAPARLTNHPHLRLPLHTIIRLHAAALNYLLSPRILHLNYQLALRAAQLTVCSVFNGVLVFTTSTKFLFRSTLKLRSRLYYRNHR